MENQRLVPLPHFPQVCPRSIANSGSLERLKGYAFLHKVCERFKLGPFAYQGIADSYLVKQAGPSVEVLPLISGILVWQS